MRPATQLLSTLFALATFIIRSEAVQKVHRTGRYLYNADGTRFFIKGIAYQPQGIAGDNAFLEPTSFIDPLADGSGCSRDVPYLQQLKVNTIRVYSVNSSLNHDSCMQTFSNAGIYTIIDLSLPVNGSITRDSSSWSSNLLDLYINTINAFAKYDNVLAYNVGNEIITAPSETGAAAIVKAAARDIKAYLSSISSSALVGYASIDGDSNWRDPLANYLGCDPSSQNSGTTAIDLYGLNNYEWCGNSTFLASGYQGTTTEFSSYNTAAYFSEFGNAACTRTWQEAQALFSSNMTSVWSGGIAFSYFQAASAAGQFGMVNISTDGSTVTTSTDFTNLATQYSAISPPNSPLESGAGSPSYPNCPGDNTTFLASTTLPPTPNDKACQCLENTLTCRFTPASNNYTSVVGPLLDAGCGLLGEQGGNCNAIASSGASGVYGPVSGCDPAVKLSFIFSQYYLGSNSDPQACGFAGNATINKSAPPSAASANAAASSCLSSATGTFVPVAPVTPTGGAPAASSSGASQGGAAGISSDLRGPALLMACGLLGGIFAALA